MTLAMDMDIDLDATFFTEGEFAVCATYRPKSRDAYPLSVMFDDPYHAEELGTPSVVGAQSRSLRVMCKEANVLGGVGPHDHIQIGDKTYKVITGESDGNGVLSMQLQAT